MASNPFNRTARGRLIEAASRETPPGEAVVALLAADLHLWDKPPLARAAEPDWHAAMARQLAQLREWQLEYGGVAAPTPLVIAGDYFDRPHATPRCVNFALKHLPHSYGVPGQHDLPGHRLDRVQHSAFWTLVEAGRLTYLPPGEPVEVPGRTPLRLWGWPWGVRVRPNPNPGDHTIDVAVVHAFAWTKQTGYKDAPESGRVRALRKRLRGYDVAVFGDNHKPFAAVEKLEGGRVRTVFNCLLPGNWVKADRICAASKAFYSGQAVEIICSRGATVRLTSNHPVLTSSGFIPADQIREGQNLLCHIGDVHALRFEDKQDRPALVEEVFSSLSQVPSGICTERRPAVGEDFHGDGRFIYSDIDVIRPNRELLMNLQAGNPQDVCYFVLQGGAMRTSQVPSPSTRGLRFRGINSSQTGGSRRLRLLLSLMRCHFLPSSFSGFCPPQFRFWRKPFDGRCLLDRSDFYAGFHQYADQTNGFSCGGYSTDSFTEFFRQRRQSLTTTVALDDRFNLFWPWFPLTVSNWNPPKFQQLGDRRMGSPQGSGYPTSGFPGCVAPDHVVRVRKFEFTGHVYDLQTGDGFILANRLSDGNGIYISNCGSFYRRKADEREHRPSVGLLMADGTVRRRYFDCDADRWAGDDELERLAAAAAVGVDLDGFIQGLRSLGEGGANFEESLRRAAAEPSVPDGVRGVILEALEGGKG